jgi:hypothetical protein
MLDQSIDCCHLQSTLQGGIDWLCDLYGKDKQVYPKKDISSQVHDARNEFGAPSKNLSWFSIQFGSRNFCKSCWSGGLAPHDTI